jgi:hypothetical protein
LTTLKPSWYTSSRHGFLSDFIDLLHPPYTLWHISYVLIGIAMAPSIYPDRSVSVVLAFFFGLGIGSHALDETMGNPLETKISKKTLYFVGFLALATAVAIGLYYVGTVSLLILPFVVVESFFAIAYNLEIFHKRFHSGLIFALSWGAIPFLTGYFVNALTLTIPVLVMALAIGLLTIVQRTLSTYARNWRRKIGPVEAIRLSGGDVVPISSKDLLSSSELSLKLLTVAIFLFSVALIALRILK